MSEKRFIVDSDFVEYPKLVDTHTNCFYHIADDIRNVEIFCERLNEQQATINELKAQLREKEEDEKLYANEILELRETNKEHIKFKSLGGDY